MDKIETLTTLLSLISSSSVYADDGAAPNTGLQVLEGDAWMPASREVWRSWTGLRAVWGVPFHGPVYALADGDDTTPWDGPRTCGCATCQAHVAPDVRPN